MKYRKKPIVIEAYQLTPDYKENILKWSTKERPIVIITDHVDDFDIGSNTIRYAEITTLEGVMRAEPNDYIIKGIQGEIYPCKPTIFEKTYEPESTT